MNGSVGSGSKGDGRRRRRSSLVPFVLALAVLAAAPADASAQADGTLEERELEYSAARNAHQSALDARAAVQARYERALDDVDAARPEGDDLLDRALAAFRERALELQGWDRRVAETAEQLEEARRSYLLAVDDRLEELYQQIALADPLQRSDIARYITDLDNRVAELERSVDIEVDVASVPLPEISFDPRDGPEELRAKADLLQRRAGQIGALVLDIDDQILSLERRLRRERIRGDFFADLNRFDNQQVPLGAPSDPTAPSSPEQNNPSGAAPAADSVALTDAQLSVPARLERLRELKTLMIQRRAEVEARAQLFLQRIGGELA